MEVYDPQKGTFAPGRWSTEFLSHVRLARPTGAECEALCDQIDRAIRDGAYKLPVFPKVAIEALQLSQDPDVTLDRIVGLLESEVAISARLLAVCNSPFYRGPSTFRSTKEVVVRLGLLQVRDVILQAVLMARVFEVPCFTTRMEEVRTQAIGVAHACRWLEVALPYREDWAFIGGLLRDLGKVVLLDILARQKRPEAVPPAMIDELLAIRHAAVGAVAAERLNLPEQISRAIAHHHDFNAASPEDRLPTLVAAGELLWTAGLEAKPEGREAFTTAPATRALRLSEPWLHRLVDRMAEAVPACAAAAVN